MADGENWKLSDFLLPKGARILHLTQVNQLKPGDHILVRFKIPIPECSGLAQGAGATIDGWHHGIYTGEKERDLWVIDMGPLDPSALVNPLQTVEANIQERTLADFAGRETHFAVYQYPKDIDTPQHRQLVLKRARDALHAEPEDQPKYNVLTSDCDTFAVYCWTGRCVRHPKLHTLVSHSQFDSKPCSKLTGAVEHKRNC